MRYANILYFILALFILGFGTAVLVGGEGKLWMNLCILLIGLYFLYRGISLTVNARIRRNRERTDADNDPANA